MGGVTTVLMFSVTRQVAIYKHPDWKFGDAVSYAALRGIVSFVLFVAVVIAAWTRRSLIALPFSRDWIITTQFVISAICFVASNVDWARLRRRDIRRLPSVNSRSPAASNNRRDQYARLTQNSARSMRARRIGAVRKHVERLARCVRELPRARAASRRSPDACRSNEWRA